MAVGSDSMRRWPDCIIGAQSASGGARIIRRWLRSGRLMTDLFPQPICWLWLPESHSAKSCCRQRWRCCRDFSWQQASGSRSNVSTDLSCVNGSVKWLRRPDLATTTTKAGQSSSIFAFLRDIACGPSTKPLVSTTMYADVSYQLRHSRKDNPGSKVVR